MKNDQHIHDENWFLKIKYFSHFDSFYKNLNIFIIKHDIILILK